jgi:predicted phosphohydrolase
MTTRKLLFQVYSDLHLELTKTIPRIKPIASYLFLAGDITKVSHPSFNEFFEYCNNKWLKTFYIMGNHDYWNPNSSMQKIKKKISDILIEKQLTNIILLDNNAYSLNDDINIVGSTFWTPSPFVSEYEGKMYINDYNMIRLLKEGIPRPSDLTPRDVNNLHIEDITFISTYLNQPDLNKNKKCIVMTHFPPQRSGTSHPKFENENHVMKNYFTHLNGTLNNFGDLSNILCWISGHTHYSYDLVSNEGVRLISNQMGYVSENLKNETNFKEDGLFEIEY